MAWTAAAAAAVQGGLSIGSTLIAGRQNKKAQERQNAANRDLMNLQYQKDREMWDQQNAYNSPAAQMQRFKDAGLNPNMIYGQGNGGNAATMPHYTAPDQSEKSFVPDTVNNVSSHVGQAIQTYQDLQMRQAQIDNLRALNSNINTRTINETMKNFLIKMNTSLADQKLKTNEFLRPYQAGIMVNRARQSEADLQREWQRVKLMSQQEQMNMLQQDAVKKKLTGLDLDNEGKRAANIDARIKNQWSQQGVTSNDNIMFRVMVRMANQFGLDMNKMKQVFKTR